MKIISEQTFAELAEVQDQHCVSIFIPTHRSGDTGIKQQDRIRLKNQIRESSEKLKSYGLSEREIEKYLEPAFALYEDQNFWNRQSDGLALFISPQEFRYFNLPISFEEMTYINNHFYLKPILPMFHGDGKFYILALTLKSVRLFEATQYSISEMILTTEIPQGLTAAVGEEIEQPMTQHHGGSREGSPGTFHGQGAGDDIEKKGEILTYLQQVDRGICDLLENENVPLIVASVDYLFPLYKSANHYINLLDDHIGGNHEHTDNITLKERAWEILKGFSEKKLKIQKETYHNQLNKNRASFETDKIIKAAINGRVQTLFLKKNETYWGVYEPESHTINREVEFNKTSAELLNIAAVSTFTQGGEVYLLEEENMPDDSSVATAIFRYDL